MFDRFRGTINEYPGRFWVLVSAAFVDRVGSTLIFPFFSLYITRKFEVGMTEAGVLFAIFSITGFIGNMLGGALSDRFGRRGSMIFGLVFSAVSSIAMGLVNDLSVFYGLAVVVGLLSEIGGPAQGAMVADLLPEEKRAEGFGVLRVAGNLAWIVGPTIGGILATRSYLMLFVLDAVSSIITAIIVYRLIPETMPERAPGDSAPSILETLGGYARVAADRLFLTFVVASMLMTVVYIQMYSTLAVYLRDVHGLPEQLFGTLLSMNALVVVISQFWVSRKLKGRPPLLMMAAGTAFYMIGFSLYGVVTTYPWFLMAMLVITAGEMIVIPIGQAVVARLAPADKRGRYMAFFALSWTLPSAIGPWGAGMIMDHFDPRWVWYLGGMIAALAIAVFYLLHVKTRHQFSDADPATRTPSPPLPESG